MQPLLRVPTGQFKPAGLPIIDWSHPRSRGLVGCYFLSSKNIVNLAGYGGDLSPVGSVVLRPGPAGFEGDSSAGGQCGWFATTPAAMKMTTEGSLVWIGRVPTAPGAPGSNPPYFGITYDNADNSPYYGLCIDNLGGAVTTFYNLGGGPGLVFGSSYTVSPLMQQYVATVRASGNARLYINGVLNATAGTSAGTFGFTATSRVQLQAHSTQASSTLTSFLMGLVYNRELSAAEVLATYENPYDILWFPNDMLMASLVGVAPNFVWPGNLTPGQHQPLVTRPEMIPYG